MDADLVVVMHVTTLLVRDDLRVILQMYLFGRLSGDASSRRLGRVVG